MSRRRTPLARAMAASCALSLSLPVWLASTPAHAQGSAALPPSPDAVKTEARDRFDRGLRLFNDGDNAGALAEFKRAYELIPNTLVLYNIGLVYAAMGRPVEAVDALERVLAAPGPVTGDRLARARQTHDDQASRIATLNIVTSVPAAIEVDGVQVGQSPLSAPLRVASGVHVVGALSSGYAPMRKEVTVAGGDKVDVRLDLVQTSATTAHVTVKTHLPGADVLVDGQPAGKTPLATSLSVPAGSHLVELRRPGYATAKEQLTLGDGADGEVTLEPSQDESAMASIGGTLALDFRESEVSVSIDGKPRGVYSSGYLLPAGPHHLEVARGGFEPTERDVTVDAGVTTTVRIALDPTPETRASYTGRTKAQRTWGIIAIAGGAVIAGGAIGFLVWNAGQKSGDQTAYDTALSNLQNKVGVCNTATAMGDANACNQAYLNAKSNLDSANTRDVVGYVGLGVGVAAAGLGVVLLLTNSDVHRYDRPQSGDASSARPSLFGWADATGGGLGVRWGY
jgi:hypothetical protein